MWYFFHINLILWYAARQGSGVLFSSFNFLSTHGLYRRLQCFTWRIFFRNLRLGSSRATTSDCYIEISGSTKAQIPFALKLITARYVTGSLARILRYEMKKKKQESIHGADI
jgi:hypothetical protein